MYDSTSKLHHLLLQVLNFSYIHYINPGYLMDNMVLLATGPEIASSSAYGDLLFIILGSDHDSHPGYFL